MGRRSDHTREELLEMAIDAAQTIVDKDGYHALSARQVAKAMGYTVGTLYLLVRNFEELMLHLNARTMNQLYMAMEKAVMGNSTPQDCIAAFAHTYVRFAKEHHARWTLLFERQFESAMPSWYLEKIAWLFSILEGSLRKLPGEHNGHAIFIASRALWSGIHGVCTLEVGNKLGMPELAPVETLIDSLVDNYLAGFMREIV